MKAKVLQFIAACSSLSQDFISSTKSTSITIPKLIHSLFFVSLLLLFN